ncbi:MAG TPA: lytic murein transglycosylase [Rubrobacteraceae bacterium]|nr:lytic murein transglycosylase [Rubrobacteraceae bacterium]
MGRSLRIWAVAAVASLVVGSGGVAGAQAEEGLASHEQIPLLEERIGERDALLEERIGEISEVGAELEEVQARTNVARTRVEELEGRTARLEGEFAAQENSFEAAKVRYEERARAAYKGSDLDRLSALLTSMLRSGSGAAAVADAHVLEILSEGRQSLAAYKENSRALRDTSRRVSETRRDYEGAIAEERALAEELRRREAKLDEAVARISTDKARMRERLRGLREAERERALEIAPATGGGGVDRSSELRVAREDIVARPVEPISNREYMKLYVSAASEYGFVRDWYVLAAVGYVESNHGENMGPSTAGAMGPMQFLPSTWQTAGVDGNGDGVANVMDPEDAIPAAAGYLQTGGAPADWYRALFTYNHADWYVKRVLGIAEAYRRLAADDGPRPYV